MNLRLETNSAGMSDNDPTVDTKRSTPSRLTNTEKERLFVALGGSGNYWIISERAFLDQTGCPPEEIERWLETEWIQHDIAAVLAGTQKVSGEPYLLVRDEDKGALRLFCPAEELFAANLRREGRMHLRCVIASRPWPDSAEEIISQVEAVAAACSHRDLSTIEIKLWCLALLLAVQTLVELRDQPFTEYVKRLHAALVALSRACKKRGLARSAQAKYGEAQVSGRRALGENHNPALDAFPELVDICRQACSKELATYMAEDVLLPCDQFLDMVHLVAHDSADAATVANPPARIRLALARADRRRQALHRQRWEQLTMANEATDPHNLESEIITNLDWERAKADLPPDQTRFVEARFEGVNLQAPDASDYLCWDPARLERARRSLGPDRPWGRRLQKRLSAYKGPRISPSKP